MQPSRPHHTVSAHYRRPGGLRALDFFVDRMESHAESCGDAGYELLVIENGDAQCAVPFAAIGFSVTSLHASDQSMHGAMAAAADVGLDVRCLVGSIESVASDTYDAIVFPDGFPQATDVDALMAISRGKLKQGGRLYAKVMAEDGGKPMGLSACLKKFSSLGWRPWDAGSAGILLGRFIKRYGAHRIGRRRLFHVLDRLDCWLSDILPRSMSDGWLMELGSFGQEPLVVQLVPTLALGGAERVALELAERLPADGYQTVLLANVAGGPLAETARVRGIRTYVLDRATHGGRWGTFWQTRRLLSDLRPELVHTHLFAADLWGRMAAKAAGVKSIVTTVHNVRTDYGFVGRLAMIALASLSQKHVAVSKDVADYVKRDWQVKSARVSVVYNGIDLDRMRRRPNQPFHDVPRLLFVGRLDAQKNPDVLLRALSGIKRPWQLQVYGNGAMRLDLVELAEDLDISPRITWGSTEDMSGVYAEHDLFIFPSRYEGLGLVVIEAAVAGLPIVASRLAPLEELFTEQEVVFVPPGDEERLALAIQTALDEPIGTVKRGQHLAEKDWSMFSAVRMSSAYAALYRRLKV